MKAADTIVAADGDLRLRIILFLVTSFFDYFCALKVKKHIKNVKNG